MPEQTLGQLLRAGRDHLRAAQIEDASIEAEVLMRQALRRENAALPTRAWLLPRLGQAVDSYLRERFEALLLRRLAREPSAYLTGLREFCALDFEVSPDVLIPRPETEQLVSVALDWASGASGHWSAVPASPASQLFLQNGRRNTDPITIVDTGTGSGAIAVSLAKRLPVATIIATDVSWPALGVARRNARCHGVEARISFRHGDLLLPVDNYVDLIVANLPYVREADWRGLEPEVRDHEPALALRGGEDGLDMIRSLLCQAPRYLRPRGAICLEFGAGQEQELRRLVSESFPGARAEVLDDFAGIPRVLVVALQPA